MNGLPLKRFTSRAKYIALDAQRSVRDVGLYIFISDFLYCKHFYLSRFRMYLKNWVDFFPLTCVQQTPRIRCYGALLH